MNQNQFKKIILKICSKDTSADPEHWSPENPLWGHCAIVSVLGQDQFGGKLIRRSLEGINGLAYLKSHYSNLFEDGEIDFTLEQFQGKLSQGVSYEERLRERVLSYPNTQRRYDLLKVRFDEARAKVDEY